MSEVQRYDGDVIASVIGLLNGYDTTASRHMAAEVGKLLAGYTDHARRVGELEAEVARLRQWALDEQNNAVEHMRKRQAAEADAGRLRADAMRYRWLRDEANAGHDAWDAIIRMDCAAEEMDAAIDAALAAGVGGGSDG